MDATGKPAWILSLAGTILLSLVAGCSNQPASEFATYDKLAHERPGSVSARGEEKRRNHTSVDPPANKSLATKQAVKEGASSSPPVVATGVRSTEGASQSVAKGGVVPASTSSAQSGRPPALPSAAPTKRKVELLIPNRSFKTEGPDGALRVSYDDIDLLKVLNMEPVTPDAPGQMPAWLKALDGRRIRIRGFMYPTFQQTGIRAFGLARDNQICCFGRNPKIYDVFDVLMREGTTTNYLPNRPFDVVGVFHIRPETDEGKLNRLYEMDDASVIAK